jgi:hypothetical protein
MGIPQYHWEQRISLVVSSTRDINSITLPCLQRPGRSMIARDICHKQTFIKLFISEMACMFFMELSQKGNTLYNVMPDIISRLSTPDLKLEEEKFKTIMK